MTQPDPALHRLMATMRSALDEYEAGLSVREWREFVTCGCGICVGMKEMRAAVEEYEEQMGLDMARTVLLQVMARRATTLDAERLDALWERIAPNMVTDEKLGRRR